MTDLEKEILERKILTKLYGDSPSDFRRHAKQGFFIYNSEEEYLESWKASLGDPEDAVIAMKHLDRVNIDGTEYLVDFVL